MGRSERVQVGEMFRRRCPKRDGTADIPIHAHTHKKTDVLVRRSYLDHVPGCSTKVVVISIVALIATVIVTSLSVDWILERPLPDPGRPDTMIPMPAFNYSEMPSFTRFYNEFRLGDKPFVIRGIPREQQSCFGDLGGYDDVFLRRLNCSFTVDVSKMVEGSRVRKGVKHIADLAASEFMELFGTPGGFQRAYGNGSYFGIGRVASILHDCPALANHLRIPAYASGQIRLHASHSGDFDFYWSTKGLNQTYHVDMPKSELWGSVCRGRKYYRVIPRTVAAQKLGWGDSAHKFLLLRPRAWRTGMPVYHGEVGPGELVYLPAGTMHAVDNLEDTVNLVNDAFDVGNLGPMSWVNRRVLEGRVLPWGWMKVLHAIGIWQPRDHWRKALEWTEDPNHRTSVYDGAGLVTDASQAPRGFPTFSQLREWGVPVPS